ncbi:AIR carboxylase family protein [Candidatus Coxiella mudrowiae]|uniref:AIR carboxylase family protein n=1 Tax=Candidatus Coxiella mudrowiae TaxID=2054173 RepID=UPI000C2857B9|nr:AIR carboxylase family protein [Candidatus Coxiella mudrowiae]
MNKSFIPILMGSDSDLSVMEWRRLLPELKSLGIPFETRILSAHRTPEATREFFEMKQPKNEGCTVFHRCRWTRCPSSRMAAHTIKPVLVFPWPLSV